MKAAVLTVSDGVHAGEREDASGDALEELLRADGFAVVRRTVPDDRDTIADAIAELSNAASLVVTTGGTGFAPRDVTPEATASVIDREAPGSRRRFAPTRSSARRTRSSRAASPVSGAPRSS